MPDVPLPFFPYFLSVSVQDNKSAIPIETNDYLRFSISAHVAHYGIVDACQHTPGVAPTLLSRLIKKNHIYSPALVTGQKAIITARIQSHCFHRTRHVPRE